MATETGRRLAVTPLQRAGAVLTLVAAALVLAPVSTGPEHGYVLALVLAGGLSALGAAARIWRTGDPGAQAVAGTLAAVAIAVQVVVCTVGAPTGSAGHWSPSAVLLVGSATLALGVLATDLRRGAQIRAEAAGRPYAL